MNTIAIEEALRGNLPAAYYANQVLAALHAGFTGSEAILTECPVIAISGPAGCGKGYIRRLVLERFAEMFPTAEASISDAVFDIFCRELQPESQDRRALGPRISSWVPQRTLQDPFAFSFLSLQMLARALCKAGAQLGLLDGVRLGADTWLISQLPLSAHIVIDAPRETRLARIMHRDTKTEQEALARINDPVELAYWEMISALRTQEGTIDRCYDNGSDEPGSADEIADNIASYIRTTFFRHAY